jgi:3-oxoacyl-[acyl-carrier protein] reductase
VHRGTQSTGVIALLTSATAFGRALADALAGASPGAVVTLAPAERTDSLVEQLSQLPQLSGLVHVCSDDRGSVGHPLTETDAAAWDAGCEQVLRRATSALQAAHSTFSRRGGGRVVMITTTAGISGAPHAVPFVAALEGTRSMAKSAARQWGADGISVNCVAVPLDLLAPGHPTLTSFLPPAALVRDDIADIAEAVRFLAGPSASGITGATLLVDGGSVMAP